jgi:hypothetical protein
VRPWPEPDRELAAALALAMRYAGTRLERITAVLDHEIAERSVVATWLIDASLLRWPEDLLHALREVAADHPLLTDPVAALETIVLGWEQGLRSAERFVTLCWSIADDGELPADLYDLIYDAEEEAHCAHETSGIPQPDRVERAVRRLLAAARGRSRWTAVLKRAAQPPEW